METRLPSGRVADRLLSPTAAILAVVMGAWVILYAYESLLPQRQHANLVLGAGLAIYYFMRTAELLRAEERSMLDNANAAFTLVLGLLALVTALYVHVAFFRWLEQGRLLIYTDLDLLVGLTIIYIVTDATFRKYGTILGLVIVGTIIYGLIGPYLPGLFGHAGMTFEEVIRRQTINLTGIYGFLLQVGATWIAIFVIFAGMIQAYGGFDFLTEIGFRVKQHSKSGVAQTAVITSMFMGTMMGAAASNVATTGSFTIPLMREHGIPPKFAAAFESVASTGGQILPPIMGTAAFLMADILGIPFAQIAIAGIIPALLFYVGTALAIHFTVVGRGWYEGAPAQPMATDGGQDPDPDSPVDEDESTWTFIARGLQYILPIAVLIYVLIVLQFGPLAAGLYTIGAAAVARGTRQLIRGNVTEFAYETVDGLKTGGQNLAPFMIILGSLGIVINIFSTTGLAQRIAFEMLDLSGGSFIIILGIAMVVSLLLGLGMPTPAAYVLVATILAPVLVQAGMADITAHFYIFYFALLSSLTPPVALAVTVAISISNTDFVETAKETLIIGAPVYLIPFMFVVAPELLVWELPATPVSAGFFAVAIVALITGLTGFLGTNTLSAPSRLLAIAFFVTIGFAPSLVIQAVAAVAFVALALYRTRLAAPVMDVGRPT